ncbi:MAG TPA: iron-containing alcohol dehydrogenase family protein [Actinomycetes bacterium]|nr:iron-containing alcohol dehydrogenase family protein [Actinomycetes bacterium]
MPLLTRMVTAPLIVDVRRGAFDELATVLADQRISTAGRVAIVLGPHSGQRLRPRLEHQRLHADYFTVSAGTVDAAVDLVEAARRSTYDAIVGIGGGRVLDVTKFAAARLGLPMVAVATNLAHDGIGSPVAILDNDRGRGSYGVPAPIAVLVDLDLVRQAPRASVAAGIGEALSNLSAVADWELAHEVTGEAIDGLAVTMSRTAARSLLHDPGDLDSDAFVALLAEALVLSGLAMVVAGTSRPCSGACHEISHAIDLLHPDRAGAHGEQVGVGAAFATWLRGDHELSATIVQVLRRHGLPVGPADLGFTDAEFVEILAFAPQTRPGRYTILEHLDLDAAGIADAVRGYASAIGC